MKQRLEFLTIISDNKCVTLKKKRERGKETEREKQGCVISPIYVFIG